MALFTHQHSDTLAPLLAELGATMFVSTYQAGKLVVVRERQGRISTLLRTFEKAMGLAVERDRLALGTKREVWVFGNSPEIGAQLEPMGAHDACFSPRWSHVTGDIAVHEVAWSGDELWLVNTRFSCLATLDPRYSFVPRWRPPFVSALAAEDRCHLNGLAIVDGRAKFVTALGRTDRAESWRENKADGGVVVDVDSGEVVAAGLSMPHSPRWRQGRLWLCDSGRGRVVVLDLKDGSAQTVAQLPGYTRGLAFCGPYALVGLSRIRETSQFGGLPIGAQPEKLQCGVWVLDASTGQTVATLEFQSDVEEIFDVQILAGIRHPAVIGLQKETLDGVFVLPPRTM